MDLIVIDVSACVHTGAASKFFKDRVSFNVPVGGIHFLMRQICNCLNLGIMFVLCFDSPSKKAASNSGYKAGRVPKPVVYNQLEFLYQELPKCSIVCEKHRGYEADDIVDWAVQQWVGKYESIQIVGNDHDLLHSVQNGVWFKSITPNCSVVLRGNFEEEADKTRTVFNTISAKKALCGCKSDSVPSIELENGMRGKELYDRFCKFLVDENILCSYKNTTDPNLLLVFAKRSGLFTSKDFMNLQRRVKLIYPAPCPDGVKITPNCDSRIDLTSLYRFLAMVGDKESLRGLGCRSSVTLTEEEKKCMYDMANRLKSGEYAADRNMPFGDSTPVLKEIGIDFFEREV